MENYKKNLKLLTENHVYSKISYLASERKKKEKMESTIFFGLVATVIIVTGIIVSI